MQEAPAEGGGGGVAEAFVQTDAQLAKITKIVGSNPQIPDEAKAAFEQALEAYRSGLQIVMEAARGGAPKAPSGAVVPVEAGASGAVPESFAGVRK